MNWDALAAIGQAFGALAVVASLLYLARQVRHSTLQSHAAARYAFISAMADVNLVIAQDKHNASVFRRGLESADELDADEWMQFSAMIGQMANAWSVMFELQREGVMPENQWAVARRDLISILSSDGGRKFWRLHGAGAFEAEFAEFVDAELAKGAKPYDMLSR